jgi:hypothetical protein
MIPVFFGQVNDGVLQVEARFHAYLATLEGPVEVVVRKKRAQRSNKQNRYYWGVVVQILSDFCGYTPEEMHEALKEKFLGSERDQKGLLRIKSTASLTTDEFAQYTNRVVIWAAQELLVYIPDPNMAEY